MLNASRQLLYGCPVVGRDAGARAIKVLLRAHGFEALERPQLFGFHDLSTQKLHTTGHRKPARPNLANGEEEDRATSYNMQKLARVHICIMYIYIHTYIYIFMYTY